MYFLAAAFELSVMEVLLLVAPEFQISFLKDLNCDAVVEAENDDVKARREQTKGWEENGRCCRTDHFGFMLLDG